MKAQRPQKPSDGFSGAQLRLLCRELDPARVRQRQMAGGGQISYLEGWFAIAEANAIFGHAGWDREIVHFERVFERRAGDETACGYVSRVKITVIAGARRLIREGTGFGQARAKMAADAHELAIKSAETDATKRALSTFGNRFGLGLYGKDATAPDTDRAMSPSAPSQNGQYPPLSLFAPDGSVIDHNLSPEGFCTGLRQLTAHCKSMKEVGALSSLNEGQISKIAALGLKTAKGTLYSEILIRLLNKKQEQFTPPPAASNEEDITQKAMHRIDKSALMIGIERRIRDKEHLKAIAQLPCLVCNRQPSHAHHLKFAQRRGLSQKVSDEYAVPVCALHHGDLHRASNEENWWQSHGVDPLPIAAELWTRHVALQT